MTETRSPTTGLIRSVPVDLLGMVIVVVLANLAVLSPFVTEPVLRIVVGLPFVLFVPGYALVAALFPEAGPAPERAEAERARGSSPRQSVRSFVDGTRTVDRWARIGLSFALSLALVPLLAMGVTLSTLAFSTVPIFATISAFSVLCVAIATKRRLSLPPQRRFRVSVVDWLASKRRSFATADSRGGVLLNVALVVAILLAVGTFGFTVLATPDGEQFTEFYLLSEDDDGELVAAEYPDSFAPGEPQPVHVGIENYEAETVDYEVVVQLQRVEESSEGTVVTERHRIDQFSASLAHEETRVDARNLTVSGALTGSDLRIEFLLYNGSVPETPTSDNAYRHLHVWVDVPDPDRTTTSSGDGTSGS